MVDKSEAEDILHYWENSDFLDASEYEAMRSRTLELLGQGLIIDGKQDQIVTEFFTTHTEEWRGSTYTQSIFYPYERQAHRMAARRKESGRFKDVKLIERKRLTFTPTSDRL